MNNSNQSDFPGKFILLDDGRPRLPFHQNVNLATFQTVLACIAIPLNVLLISAVLYKPELRNKPRNIFLISVILSDLSAMSESLIEVGHIFLSMEKNETYSDQLCKVYIAIYRLPDILILVTTLLSLIDRYVAIRRPLWHRSKVTALWATFAAVLTTIITVFVNKFVYIFQIVPLRCGVHSLERRIVAINLCILVFICLMWRIIVYFETRRILGNRNIQVASTVSSGNCERSNNENILDAPYNPESQQQNERFASHISAQLHLGNVRPTTLRRNYPTILHRELEMEAIKNLVSGVTSLLILSCPITVFIVGMNICRSVSSTQRVCSRYSWLSEYVKQCYQLYGLYHPILYLGWNKEFYHVLRNPLIRLSNRLIACFRAMIENIRSYFVRNRL